MENVQANLLNESLTASDREFRELEEAYNELDLLREAMETGDFMILLGENKVMTENDINKVRAKIHNIMYNNEIIRRSGAAPMDSTDGRSVLKNLGKRVYLGLNKWFSALISGYLGWVALGLFFAGGIFSMTLGAIVASFSALFAAGSIKNHQALKSFETANEVVAISELISKSKPVNVSERRSMAKRLWQKATRKKPKEVYQNNLKITEENAKKASRNLQNVIRNLPQTIRYSKDDGTFGEYPTYKLFERF